MYMCVGERKHYFLFSRDEIYWVGTIFIFGSAKVCFEQISQ